jgi:glycosyltransferase involved in cell wall biosynthesis
MMASAPATTPVADDDRAAHRAAARHLLINGLSIGSGGGYTVGRELLRHIALARPHWTVTMAVIGGHPLHEQLRTESLPPNARLHWAPPATVGRAARARYEDTGLVPWAHANGVHVVLQLNGMVIPRMRLPTLAHFQDPWPYRREAWRGWRDRAVALLKRRQHARALREAACAGFTSGYLRDLICGHWRHIRPRRTEVFYNGLPPESEARAADAVAADDWTARPMEIVSVSNVNVYKRQELVIRALPELIRRPGLGELRYRIAGHCEPAYRAELEALARELGVADRVVFAGRIDDDEVERAFRGARAFVLMSVCESFGIPAIEAMSFGTPVVTSDCCAMPEVCGPAAELCPVDDLPALVDRLARVLSDPARADELRRRGAEQVRRFRWATTAEQMATALEEISEPARQPTAAAAKR